MVELGTVTKFARTMRHIPVGGCYQAQQPDCLHVSPSSPPLSSWEAELCASTSVGLSSLFTK